MEVSVVMPMYFMKSKKRTMVGMNVFRNLHYTTKNKLKRDFASKVFEQLEEKNIKFDVYDGLYECEFILYYENKLCDMPNVCSLIDKFVLDAFVTYGVVKNDNVARYVKSTYVVGGQDKQNPRVVVNLRTIDKEEDK